MTFADKVIAFNKNLDFRGKLPNGIEIINPFKINRHAFEASSKFYRKFYNDNKPRKLILG